MKEYSLARQRPNIAPPRPRFRRLAEAAKVLAPIIAQVRKAGFHSIEDIGMVLDDMDLRAPSGRHFSYETTRQLLKEIEAQGLGKGPRSRSEALSARHAEKRAQKVAMQ